MVASWMQGTPTAALLPLQAQASPTPLTHAMS
jgi:hypothetical protein